MPVSSNNLMEMQQTINKLVEAMQPLVGQVQNKLERAVTFEDLKDGGFDVGAFMAGGSGSIGIPPVVTDKPDMSVPPKVTGFTAVASWELAILSWDASAYKNHAFVEVFRATGFKDEAMQVPTTILDAVYIGQSNSVAMGDHVVSNHHYRYWARNVSQQGVVSDWDSEEGTDVFAPRSPKEYISIVSGEIKKDDLYITLGQEIDRIPIIAADVDENSAYIIQNSSKISTLEGSSATHTSQIAANTTSITSLTGLVSSNTAIITQQGTAITSLTGAQATLTSQVSTNTDSINSLGGIVDSNTAIITQQGTAITSLTGAQALLTTQVSANANTIEQNFNVTTQHGQLINASYTVKIDAGGAISGFGLMTDASGNSRFAIRADRFYVAPPSKGIGDLTTADIPFIVNGNDTLIKNAYIDTAYIQTLVTGSLIATKITGQTITGVHIIGGDLSIGNNFTVDGQGNMVATNGYFAGQIQANSGVLNNVQINENCTILGTMTAKQIRGDVVNFKRVASPANGVWYEKDIQGPKIGAVTLIPVMKIATLTFESWATARRVMVTNLLLGVIGLTYEVGSGFTATVEARLPNGAVIRSWYINVPPGTYPGNVNSIIGKSIAVGQGTATTKQIEFDFPAGQTQVQFWFTATSVTTSGNGITRFRVCAEISNSSLIGQDNNTNFFGAFADVQYMSTGYSSGVVIS